MIVKKLNVKGVNDDFFFFLKIIYRELQCGGDGIFGCPQYHGVCTD